MNDALWPDIRAAMIAHNDWRLAPDAQREDAGEIYLNRVVLLAATLRERPGDSEWESFAVTARENPHSVNADLFKDVTAHLEGAA